MSHAEQLIERIRGPHDGVVELILVQSADWESDPFLVKGLREKIAQYQAFLVGEEFHRNYANCRGSIVLETSHFPPEEIQQLLAKEGIEVRIAKSMSIPDGIHQVRETNGVIELVVEQMDAWDTDPFLVKNLRDLIAACRTWAQSDEFRDAYPKMTSVVIIDTIFAPPSEVQQLLMRSGAEIHIGGEPLIASTPTQPVASAQPKSTAPAPAQAVNQAPAPTPSKAAVQTPEQPVVEAPVEAPKAPEQPMFVRRAPEPQNEDAWDDDPYDVADVTPQGSGMSPVVLGAGIVCVLFVLGMLYSMFAGGGAEQDTPQAVDASSVSANTLPRESWATVAVRPDPRTFTMIPIVDAKTGKQEIFFLFSTLESRKLLIFASKQDCKILAKMGHKIHPVTEEKSLDPKWVSDLKGQHDKIQSRTYIGRLEKAQRREGGVVALVLPDGNRNINKVYKQYGIQFSKDSMILVVGKKPKPNTGSSGLIFFICLLGGLASGGFALFSLQQNKRSF